MDRNFALSLLFINYQCNHDHEHCQNDDNKNRIELLASDKIYYGIKGVGNPGYNARKD
ncbi:hypothetical protein ES703_115672 [subsurface metagenome]